MIGSEFIGIYDAISPYMIRLFVLYNRSNRKATGSIVVFIDLFPLTLHYITLKYASYSIADIGLWRTEVLVESRCFLESAFFASIIKLAQCWSDYLLFMANIEGNDFA